jgi:hypothetical protein
MKIHITPQVFQEIIKKSYNLDIVYLLKLIEENYDIAPMYENSMKIDALYQSLIRKQLITNDNKVTLLGKDLLEFIKIEKDNVTLPKRQPITTDFEEWWKNYPPTDSFIVDNQIFKGTRALRRGKEECKRKFKTILEEGTYTAEQLINALKYEVNQKIERSVKERKNILSFMQGSIPYLNQRSFEGFIQLMVEEKDAPKVQSGPVDI